MSKISKLVTWLSQAYSYSTKEIFEAVDEFKRDIDKGKLSLRDLNKGMQRLMILKYPWLKFGHQMERAKEKRIVSYHPIVIRTTDKEHPDQKMAQYWKDWKDWPDLTIDEAMKVFRHSKELISSVKADGELEVLHYKKKGIPLVGMNAKTHESMKGKTTKCLMSNHGSHVYYNNPITVAFQKKCESEGYEEVIVLGEAFGMHQGRMLPFPPRPPGTSDNILLGDDWESWKKYINFWIFDIRQIDNKIYFPKGRYKDRLKKSKELFGMADMEEVKPTKNPSKYQNGQILREVDRRMVKGTRMRFTEDKSMDGIISDSKRLLYNGYSISFFKPAKHLHIFKNIADTFSKMPEFARSSFGMSDVFMISDKTQKGRYLIIPIPTNMSAKKERLEDAIHGKPWIYRLRKRHRVKEPALMSFVKFVKVNKKYKGRKIKMEKTKIRKVFRLKLIKKGSGPSPSHVATPVVGGGTP